MRAHGWSFGLVQLPGVVTMHMIFKRRHWACLANVALILISLGTSHNCGPRDRPQCGQYDEFFALGPTDQRNSDFRNYPIETQLEIYICGWYCEPAPRYYADYIADRGEEVISSVVDRLQRERREFSQQALVYILVRIANKGYLRGRLDVLDAITPIVSSMKNQLTRQSSQQYLDEIKKYV